MSIIDLQRAINHNRLVAFVMAISKNQRRGTISEQEEIVGGIETGY